MFIQIALLASLLSHTRFVITIRSRDNRYHSLLLFRLTSNDTKTGEENGNAGHQIYVMESSCPHLGADLSHAEIEECGPEIVAVCPWHRYDFDLRTGKSETGLRACVYTVQVRNQEGQDYVWVETPDGNDWELVDLRPVSEAFADPPPPPDISQLSLEANAQSDALEPVVPEDNPPKTLLAWASLILNTANASLKVERTRHAVNLFRTGSLKSIGRLSGPPPPDVPPREEGMQIVDPSKVGKRGKAGSLKNRVAMLHALANIEQWAIDLSWDVLARFGPLHPSLPAQFFTDFTKVALDESKHFSLLSARLSSLGTPYGSLPIHSSLWQSAIETAQSLKSRLAIIHLVHEARGIDCNPATIEKFRKAGDDESVKVLEVIHLDEITHVTAGHRWFTYICAEEGIDPVATFREEVRKHFHGVLKGPFNVEDRKKAGMSPEYYEDLEGEKGLGASSKEYVPSTKEDSQAKIGVGYEEAT